MIRRTGLLAVCALLAAILAASCGGGDRLTIYSGRGQNLVGPLLDRFAQERGIGIDVRYGNSADLALLIAEEGERTPAHVFLSQSPGAVGYLAERDLLRPLPAEVLDRVDERFRSDAGLWVGVSGRLRVLVYNRELVAEQELPTSVFDLTGPAYEGRVAVAPPNASFQDFVTAMRQEFGDDRTFEWLEGLVANGVRTYPNNNAIVDAVARGEVPMGLVNHYYNERFLAEDPSLPSRNHVFPEGDIGALLLMASASVLSDDPRAIEFVDFLLSEEAQRYFADETFEYPLAAGVEPAGDLPQLDALTLPDVEVEQLGDELETTLELIERADLQG